MALFATIFLSLHTVSLHIHPGVRPNVSATVSMSWVLTDHYTRKFGHVAPATCHATAPGTLLPPTVRVISRCYWPSIHLYLEVGLFFSTTTFSVRLHLCNDPLRCV